MIRRDFLTVLGGGASSLVTGRGDLFNPFNNDSPDLEKRAAKIIREYDAQGIHRTATEVDNRSARWLGKLVSGNGAAMSLMPFNISRVDPVAAYIQIGDRRIEGLPIFDAAFTNASGIAGTLGPLGSEADIGLVEAPPNAEYGPTYSKMRRETKHRAIVLITTGSAKGLSPINGSEFEKPYGPPILQVSNTETEFLKQKAGEVTPVKFFAFVKRTNTTALNVMGHIKGADPSLAPIVVMTPRSGWWQCASERGGGLVCWLETMRALAAVRPARDCIFIASSGHEIGHIGLDHFLDKNTELVPKARIWLHFGANIGAAVEPGHRLQCSEDELERISLEEFVKTGAKIDEKIARGTVPYGEAGNIHRRGGHYISIVGRNGMFHSPDDRWPSAVDIKMVAKFASAFSQLALRFAGA